jgi:hypothetical protein
MLIDVWPLEDIQDSFLPSLCSIIKWKATELLGNMVCSANWLLDSYLGLVWISYQTVRGALLCSCRLFAPRFSAIHSLQECSSLFEKPKGSTAFTGYAVGSFVLTPLHFVTARRLNCYICGPTRQVSVVFVTMQGGDSTHHWKSWVLVLSWSHIFYIICIQ